MVTHPPEEITAFLDGEPRLIAAAWRHGREGLFVLPENSAVEHRPLAKSELKCFVPGCPSPELTTVHRTRARDGFRHLTSGVGSHSGEGIHHVQAKYALAQWLQVRVPSASVQVEQASDDRRSRVADVMLVPPDGALKIAFEIQYAALTPEEWKQRHRSYVIQGIVDVWLFGHQGRQMRVRPAKSRVQVNPVHEAVVRAGLPLLWFNPYTMQVATASTTWVSSSFPSLDVFPGLSADESEGRLRVEDIELAQVDPLRGLSSPQIDSLQAATDRVRLLVEKREREDAVRRRAATLATEAAAAQLKSRTDEWTASADCLRRLQSLGGTWPAELNVTPSVPFLWPPTMWQSHLWERLVWTAGIGGQFSTDDAITLVQELVAPEPLETYAAFQLCLKWALGLRKAGLLKVLSSQNRRSGIYLLIFQVTSTTFRPSRQQDPSTRRRFF